MKAWTVAVAGKLGEGWGDKSHLSATVRTGPLRPLGHSEALCLLSRRLLAHTHMCFPSLFTRKCNHCRTVSSLFQFNSHSETSLSWNFPNYQ